MKYRLFETTYNNIAVFKYKSSSDDLDEKVIIRDLNCKDPTDPSKSLLTHRVFFKNRNDEYPDYINLKYNVTNDVRDFIISNCHSLNTLTEEFGNSFRKTIYKIFNDAVAEREKAIISTFPKIIGFSVYQFHRRKIILVHDLTTDAEYPIIDIVYLRDTAISKNSKIQTLKSYILTLIDTLGADYLSDMLIILPYSQAIYNAVYLGKEHILEIGIPEKSKIMKQKANTITNDMDDYVSETYDKYCIEIERRHLKIANSYTSGKVSDFRKILMLKKF